MSETPDAPANDTPETPEIPATPDTGDSANPNREAAKYRTRLREVESERDALATQLEASQRSIVDDLVSRHGYTSDLFWSGGTELPALLNEDGTVDANTVTESLRETAQRFGVQSKVERDNALIDPSAGAPIKEPTSSRSWRDVLQS